MYELPQKMGKYRTIPRTEGISTTDIGEQQQQARGSLPTPKGDNRRRA